MTPLHIQALKNPGEWAQDGDRSEPGHASGGVQVAVLESFGGRMGWLAASTVVKHGRLLLQSECCPSSAKSAKKRIWQLLRPVGTGRLTVFALRRPSYCFYGFRPLADHEANDGEYSILLLPVDLGPHKVLQIYELP